MKGFQMTDTVEQPVVAVKKKPRKKNIKPPEGAAKIIFPDDVEMKHQWQYQGTPLLEIPEGITGFVYNITNLLTGKMYIGKKKFFGTKIRSIKKQQYRERVQSDFVTYYGSNDALKADVATHGPEHFHREILLLCETPGQASYYEAKYQFHYDVIGSLRFYNEWISIKVTKAHLKPQHYLHSVRTDLMKILAK